MKEELFVFGGSSDPNSFGPAFYLFRRIYNDGRTLHAVFDCGAEFYVDTDGRKSIRGGNFDGLKKILDGHKIDAVILSHGHLDHIGMLPKLKRDLDPEAKVWASPQTHHILYDNCWDTLQISKGVFTHFEVGDVTSESRRTILQPGENEILPDLKMFAGPNGHVPGSMFIILRLADGGNVLFLNDFSIHDQPVVKGARFLSEWLPEEWRPIKKVVTMDLTYGLTERKKWDDELARLKAWIEKILARGGKVIIPAFRFGRGQNIALALAKLGFDVVVDGGIRSTFLAFLAMRWSENDINDFSFEHISFVMDKGTQGAIETTIAELEGRWRFAVEKENNADEVAYLDRVIDELNGLLTRGISRRELAASRGPAIVITTAGMGDGGPFGKYAGTSLENPNDGIARVGYCAPGTTMDRIIQAKKAGGGKVMVVVDRKPDKKDRNVWHDVVAELSVNCDIGEFSFSAHADLNDSASYFADVVQNVNGGERFDCMVLTHGSQAAKRRAHARFAEFVEKQENLIFGETNVVVPLS